MNIPLRCLDCNTNMKLSHSYTEIVSIYNPPTSLTFTVDENGDGTQTFYIYVCPKCKLETNSGKIYSE